MFSIKFHTIFYYVVIILIYNQNISFGQYPDTEEHNNNDVKITSKIVEDIVRKVCNITAGTLAGSNHIDKERLIHKIEEKLYKSASSLRDGEAYVRMLMKGVRLVAYKNNRKNTVVARANNEPKLEEKSKSDIINNIAEKVQIIAKALAKSNTNDDQKRAIQEIKKMIDETASKKHNRNKVKSYRDLITQGIEQAILNVPRRASSEPLEYNYMTDNYLVKRSEDDSSDTSIVDRPELKQRAIKHTRLKPNTLLEDMKGVDCTEVKIHLCNDINALNVLQCPSDNTQLDISKLCDGVIDCTDNSDEQDCTKKVSNIVHSATKLVMQIESSIALHCYPNSVEDEILSRQNEVLRKVLEIQLKFIEKHSNDRHSLDTSKNPGNTFMLRSTINELVTLIDTLSTGLKSTLCITPNLRKFNSEDITNNEIDTIEKQEKAYELTEEVMTNKSIYSLEKCVCESGSCKESSCSHYCMVFCGQQYALGRWQCNAVGDGHSVAIDVVCDGKLDCIDHSDEEACVFGFNFAKFKAHVIFENIQDIILAKIKSEQNASIRNKMIRFFNFLKDLHGKITHKTPELVDIKQMREYTFTALVEILEESGKVKTINEIASLFKVLMSWNVQLVKALKRTHTGNDRIIISDGCFCSGNKCAQVDCPKFCVKACSSETILTRYYCEGSNRYEDSVPISAICNGTVECQKRDDESDCNKESCRLHHLLVLRSKITKVGDNFRGTAVGDALGAWKTKVNASIKVVEGEGTRPTLKIIRKLVRVMLRDLVMTYAGLEDSKRTNTDHILDEFIKISRILFESFRACAY